MKMYEELVADFVARGWESNPLEKLLVILGEHPDQRLPLALLVLELIPDGCTFFDQLLSFLSETEFRELVDTAVRDLERGQSEVVDSVIAFASLQFPQLLTPHLREIFTNRPNLDTYYEEWPWRGADDREVSILKDIVRKQHDPEIQKRAWRCLIETRQTDLIEFARLHFDVMNEELNEFSVYAQLAGFDSAASPARKLHDDLPHHITFPPDYFQDDLPDWMKRSNHPTWTPQGEVFRSGRIGGPVEGQCGGCGGQLHLLLRIDDAGSLLPVTVPNLELTTCLSCLGWEEERMYFKHDGSGRASSLTKEPSLRSPEFPAGPLKPSSISIAPTPPRWVVQDWALSNSRENLNRIAGAPSWVQDAEYPECPTCGAVMFFVAQLDSDLPTAEGSEWFWGSGGICYLFWCDPCRISANLWQCT